MSFKMTSERYAKALYEVSADVAELDSVKQDMKMIDELLTALPEIRKYCLNHNPSDRDALKLLEIAFLKYIKSPKCVNTLKLMVKNDRISSIPFLSEAFFALCEEKENRLGAVAQFAKKPEDHIIAELQKKLSDKTGRKVAILSTVTPALLGGFILTWHNRMIDNSAKGRIKQLKRVLGVSA